MIYDPCKCGIKPEAHAHVMNGAKDEVIFWKGAPIIDDVPLTKYFTLNKGEVVK